MSDEQPTVEPTPSADSTSMLAAVIICCYTDRRWDVLTQSIESVTSQLEPADALVVVVDYNPSLEARLRSRYPKLTVLPNEEPKGLSGARNTGLSAVTQDVVLFLDDDAVARPGWLKTYREAFSSDGRLVAAGGSILAWWEVEEPAWFPAEFGWVVGCDYIGLPPNMMPIRNPIGASMAVRRRPTAAVGGFSHELGRVNDLPAGCEETELSIRLREAHPDAHIVRLTAAVVDHLVPADRGRIGYFTRRCYHEGRSKAILARAVGGQPALSTERSYVTHTLVAGVGRYLRQGLGGSADGWLKAAAIALGLGCTTYGFLQMKVRPLGRKAPTHAHDNLSA